MYRSKKYGKFAGDIRVYMRVYMTDFSAPVHFLILDSLSLNFSASKKRNTHNQFWI